MRLSHRISASDFFDVTVVSGALRDGAGGGVTCEKFLAPTTVQTMSVFFFVEHDRNAPSEISSFTFLAASQLIWQSNHFRRHKEEKRKRATGFPIFDFDPIPLDTCPINNVLFFGRPANDIGSVEFGYEISRTGNSQHDHQQQQQPTY